MIKLSLVQRSILFAARRLPAGSPALKVPCPRCQQIIGAADASGEVIEHEHAAPCGLPCNDTGHKTAHNCPRCCYKTCPVCDGKRFQGYRVVPRTALKNLLWEDTHFDSWQLFNDSCRIKPCTRCGGVGKIPGLELFLEKGE